MAEFCSGCTHKFFDINLAEIAIDLERGNSENFICEDCNRRCVYKDEIGRIFIGFEVDGELNLQPVFIENL